MKYNAALARAIVLAACIFTLVVAAKCSISGPRKPESSPVLYYNPHQYQLGRIMDLDLVHLDSGKTWVVIRWVPSYAPLLYSEEINFCSTGDVARKLDGVKLGDEIILIYSRAIEISRIDGSPKDVVTCRSLDYVRKIKETHE